MVKVLVFSHLLSKMFISFGKIWDTQKQSQVLSLTSIPTCIILLSWFHLNQFYHYHGPKRKFGKFESNITETGEAMPTKIGLHVFQVNLYLHEFFKPILFFDPHGL